MACIIVILAVALRPACLGLWSW